jgi:hypothetical protein
LLSNQISLIPFGFGLDHVGSRHQNDRRTLVLGQLRRSQPKLEIALSFAKRTESDPEEQSSRLHRGRRSVQGKAKPVGAVPSTGALTSQFLCRCEPTLTLYLSVQIVAEKLKHKDGKVSAAILAHYRELSDTLIECLIDSEDLPDFVSSPLRVVPIRSDADFFTRLTRSNRTSATASRQSTISPSSIPNASRLARRRLSCLTFERSQT